MKMKMVASLVSCALYLPVAQAGSLTVANSDLTLAGGMSAGLLYSDNTGGTNNTDAAVTDFLLELSASADKGVGFVAGYGLLQQASLLDNVQADRDAPTPSMDFQYGWLTIKPSDAITIDAGKLATKIGYEVANSYANANILLGGVWNAQPVYYPGVRASFAVGEGSVFIEANEDTATGATTGYVVGGGTTLGPVALSLAYYDANKGRDIVDVIVSGEIGGIPVAANLDFHKIDSEVAVPGDDDSAMGIALYATPSFGAITVPVRVEYFDDGTSGIYGGMKSGYSFTVTPTYNFTDNTFVRAEVAMVSSDNKIFTDEKGVTQDSKTSAALQAGFLF